MIERRAALLAARFTTNCVKERRNWPPRRGNCADRAALPLPFDRSARHGWLSRRHAAVLGPGRAREHGGLVVSAFAVWRAIV